MALLLLLIAPTETAARGGVLPSSMASATEDCTLWIGFSQVAEWFMAGTPDCFTNPTSPHHVVDGRSELRWCEGCGVERWAMTPGPTPTFAPGTPAPVMSAWDASCTAALGESHCYYSACDAAVEEPERVVFVISDALIAPDLHTPAGYEPYLTQAIENVRAHYPSARQIVLQTVSGGPQHSTCYCKPGASCAATPVSTPVRSSVNHPVIDLAIAEWVAAHPEQTDVVAGLSPEVDDCNQFSDATGHLTSNGACALAMKIAALHDGATAAPTATSTPTPTAPPPATASTTATSTAPAAPTPSAVPTASAAASPTAMLAPTATATLSSSATATVAASPTATVEPTPTAPPGFTSTPTAELTATPAFAPTSTATAPSSATATAAPSSTLTLAPTSTATADVTETPTAERTATATLAPTSSVTASFTVPATDTPSSTATLEPTSTLTAAVTSTPTIERTATPTLGAPETPTDSPTVIPLTETPVATATASEATVPPTFAPTPPPTPRPTAPVCMQGCAGNASTSAEDLLVAVQLALSTGPIDACAPFDLDGSASITVDEVLRAVHAAASPCRENLAVVTPEVSEALTAAPQMPGRSRFTPQRSNFGSSGPTLATPSVAEPYASASPAVFSQELRPRPP